MRFWRLMRCSQLRYVGLKSHNLWQNMLQTMQNHAWPHNWMFLCVEKTATVNMYGGMLGKRMISEPQELQPVKLLIHIFLDAKLVQIRQSCGLHIPHIYLPPRLLLVQLTGCTKNTSQFFEFWKPVCVLGGTSVLTVIMHSDAALRQCNFSSKRSVIATQCGFRQQFQIRDTPRRITLLVWVSKLCQEGSLKDGKPQGPPHLVHTW